MTPARLQMRAAFVLGLVLVALVALMARLAQIQLVDHEQWSRSARLRHWARPLAIPAERGFAAPARLPRPQMLSR